MSKDVVSETHSTDESNVVERRIGLAAPFAGIAGIFVFSVAFAGIGLALFGEGSDPGPDIQTVLFGFAGSWAGMLTGILWASNSSFRGLPDLLGLRFRRSDLWLGFGVALAAQVITVLVFLPVKLISPDAYSQVNDSAQELTSVATGWWIPPFVICVCVIAPLMEELFFRGVVLKAASQHWGVASGVFVSAFVFGIIHFQNYETIPLVVFGILLALATVKTGRLGSAIIAHMVFNSVSLIVLLG